MGTIEGEEIPLHIQMMKTILRIGGIDLPRGIDMLGGTLDGGGVVALLARTNTDRVVDIVGLGRERSGIDDLVGIDIVGGLEIGIITPLGRRMRGAGRMVESIGGE